MRIASAVFFLMPMSAELALIGLAGCSNEPPPGPGLNRPVVAAESPSAERAARDSSPGTGRGAQAAEEPQSKQAGDPRDRPEEALLPPVAEAGRAPPALDAAGGLQGPSIAQANPPPSERAPDRPAESAPAPPPPGDAAGGFGPPIEAGAQATGGPAAAPPEAPGAGGTASAPDPGAATPAASDAPRTTQTASELVGRFGFQMEGMRLSLDRASRLTETSHFMPSSEPVEMFDCMNEERAIVRSHPPDQHPFAMAVGDEEFATWFCQNRDGNHARTRVWIETPASARLGRNQVGVPVARLVRRAEMDGRRMRSSTAVLIDQRGRMVERRETEWAVPHGLGQRLEAAFSFSRRALARVHVRSWDDEGNAYRRLAVFSGFGEVLETETLNVVYASAQYGVASRDTRPSVRNAKEKVVVERYRFRPFGAGPSVPPVWAHPDAVAQGTNLERGPDGAFTLTPQPPFFEIALYMRANRQLVCASASETAADGTKTNYVDSLYGEPVPACAENW